MLDLAAAERFYVDLLGLVVSERAPGALYLRGWEERPHHSLVLSEGPVAGVRRLSFRVRGEADLDALAADFAARGCETASGDGEHPGIGRALHVRDPFGFPLAFFREMSQFETQLQRFDLQHGAPIARIDHFNLHVTDVETTFRFWQSLGFRCTEYISTDGPGRADHGRLAGAQADRPRRRADGRRRPAAAPPRLRGRRTRPACCARATSSPRPATPRASSAARGATASRTPSSSTCAIPRGIASSCTRATTTPAIPTTSRCAGRPRMPSCRSFWGARAPDRWYNESSFVLGPDGQAGRGDRRRRRRARLVPRRGRRS